MNLNRVLSVLVGICVVVVVVQAQVATPFGERQAAAATPTGQRGGRGAVASNAAPAATVQTAWWTDPALMVRLGLTDLQKSRIETTFQAYRQNLTSTKDTLEKEEAQLSRLLDADSIDRPAVQLQVNKVIQARSEMERVNAAMTLEIREQLTRAQWTQLQAPSQTPFGVRGVRGGAPVANPAPDSFAAKFDANKPITLEGTVTEFKFQEPHVLIVFDAVGKDGKLASWTGEMGGSTNLSRAGFTSTSLKAGDRIVVEGSLSRDPSENSVNVRSVRRLP